MQSFSEVPIKSGNRNPQYNFNQEIESKLKGFKTYLQELGNGENTIRQKLNYTGCFLKWLESENLQAEETSYNDLLNFIDYCRLEERSTRQINSTLRSIKNYFEYLKTNNPEIINPASNLQLKGKVNKLPSNIISYPKLENIYQSFPSKAGQVPPTNREKRNKIILGLLIYQGITTEELQQLEPSHIKLKEGKIYVPGNRRRNSRTLELKPFQILELHEYVTETRPQILKEITKPKPARKPDKINKARLKEQLFISINGSENIKNSLHHLFQSIRKTNPGIRSAKQIRASVITHWLKTYNLRQVQYFAGHKYVSSTERYHTNNLDKLQDRLEKLHPLNH
jgi:integrase/recombinase XerD